MRILHAVQDLVLYQTHLKDGHIWMRIANIDVPLTKHFDEEGAQYSYFYKDNIEERVYLVTDEEEYNNLPNL